MAKKKKAKKSKKAKGLWTKADINLLKKLFSNNPTASIAAKLRRPTEAVKKKASRTSQIKKIYEVPRQSISYQISPYGEPPLGL